MDKHIPCYKCGYEIQMMDIFTQQIKQSEEQGSKTKKDPLQLSDKFWQKLQDILRSIKP